MSSPLQGSSGASLATLAGELDSVLATSKKAAEFGDALFSAADVLRDQPALRRAVTDPSTEAAAKSALVQGVFGPHLDAPAVALVATAATLRWARSSDLAEALEHLAVVALVKAAGSKADQLEDELFQLGQAIADHHDLRDALSDPGRSVADKQALLAGLLKGKASPGTIRLAERAVSGGRVTRALAQYAEIAAASRQRLVALVRSATPLSTKDQTRLADVLARQYDQPVHLNVVLDPTLVGGARVEVGDQVIDGTIASRLDDARRRLVG